MTEKELKKLFEQKMEGLDFEFKEANWQAFEQMTDPQEPMSEQAFKKLFRDKLGAASFPFNPANWEEMEEQLGPEHGMSDQDLEKLFTKKIAESDFAYNPENWSRMEAILDQRAVRPLAFFWRSAAAIFAAAGISALLLWQNGGQANIPLEPEFLASPKVETLDVQSPKVQEIETTTNTITEELVASQEELPAAGSISTPKESFIRSNKASLSGVRPITNVAEVELSSSPLNAEKSPVPAEAKPWSNESKWHPIEPGLPNLQLGDWPNLSIINALLADNNSPKEVYVPKSYSKWSLVAGTGFSQAMNGSMGNPGWQAGFEYEYGWNDRHSLQTGLIYAQSGDIGVETIHDSTFFGLGRTEVQTHRHYKSLKTLQIPLSYQYQVLPKHRFGLGVQADILLSVMMDQTRTTTVFKQDPKVEHQHFDQSMNSFAPLNLSASLSYQYQYTPRLSIGFNYVLALNDITQDHVQDFEADHRPSQANLQLRYRLFEK